MLRPSATAEISPANISFWKSKKKGKSGCVSLAASEVPQEAFTAVLKYDDNK